ncbi:hypothetical protein GCM10027271_44000 [Saccharopolyspora gloriosae]
MNTWEDEKLRAEGALGLACVGVGWRNFSGFLAAGSFSQWLRHEEKSRPREETAENPPVVVPLKPVTARRLRH